MAALLMPIDEVLPGIGATRFLVLFRITPPDHSANARMFVANLSEPADSATAQRIVSIVDASPVSLITARGPVKPTFEAGPPAFYQHPILTNGAQKVGALTKAASDDVARQVLLVITFDGLRKKTGVYWIPVATLTQGTALELVPPEHPFPDLEDLNPDGSLNEKGIRKH